jgi:hypothetical protein
VPSAGILSRKQAADTGCHGIGEGEVARQPLRRVARRRTRQRRQQQCQHQQRMGGEVWLVERERDITRNGAALDGGDGGVNASYSPTFPNLLRVFVWLANFRRWCWQRRQV